MKKNRKNTKEINHNWLKSLCSSAIFCFSFFPLAAQKISFHSAILEADRQISVHLPASFDSLKAYPVIYVLDGDRIGSLFASTNDYLVSCERTLPAIVVAIHQDSLRWKDCGYVYETSAFSAAGQQFHEFIRSELIPYVNAKYKTTEYIAFAGHSFTATYVYLTFLKGAIPFQSYIALSPYLPDDLQLKVKNHLVKNPGGPDLYTVTAERDLSGHKTSIGKFQKSLIREKLDHNIRFRDFPGKSHLTLVPAGIEEGLTFIFKDYQSLSNAYLFSRKIPVIDKNRLENYYLEMNRKYAVQEKLRSEDAEFALFTLSHHGLWDQTKELSEWVIAILPDHYSGYYGLGAFYEKQKDYTRSLEYFWKGYDQIGPETLNKSDFYKDIERVEAKVKK